MQKVDKEKGTEIPATAITEDKALSADRAIYVASRASLPERGEMWRKFRSEGVNITSSWIDEDGAGETGDWRELWERIANEISDSTALVLYAEPDDFPLKGAYIEAGIALGLGIDVVLCLPGVTLTNNWRPIGSWVNHPLVSRIDNIEDAVAYALTRPAESALRGSNPKVSSESSVQHPPCLCFAPPTDQHLTWCPREGMDFDSASVSDEVVDTIAEIRARRVAISPAPWQHIPPTDNEERNGTPRRYVARTVGCGDVPPEKFFIAILYWHEKSERDIADADFIANAPTDIDYLDAALTKSTEENKRLLEAYDAAAAGEKNMHEQFRTLEVDWRELSEEEDRLRARLVEVVKERDDIKIAEIHAAQRCLAAESQRDQLIATLESRTQAEVEMLAEVVAENDSLRIRLAEVGPIVEAAQVWATVCAQLRKRTPTSRSQRERE